MTCVKCVPWKTAIKKLSIFSEGRISDSVLNVKGMWGLVSNWIWHFFFYLLHYFLMYFQTKQCKNWLKGPIKLANSVLTVAFGSYRLKKKKKKNKSIKNTINSTLEKSGKLIIWQIVSRNLYRNSPSFWLFNLITIMITICVTW